MEGRAKRKDTLATLTDFLNSQVMVDFMSVLFGALCGDIYASYADSRGQMNFA